MTAHSIAADFRSPKDRFLSADECNALLQRVVQSGRGGGRTSLSVKTAWIGNIRWANNDILSGGDVRTNDITITREIRGASGSIGTNQIDDASLEAAVRRAERVLTQLPESFEWSLWKPVMEKHSQPKLWFDRTYQLQAADRAEAMRVLLEPSIAAGMRCSGHIQVSAHGRALLNEDGLNLYYPYTQAQYSVTVRDPNGTASGWAGVDWNDWGRIDTQALSAAALEKCLMARNPVAAEPGQYTAILEPQAVADFVGELVNAYPLDRVLAEQRGMKVPFMGAKRGETKIGQPVIDSRLTISADPMDPDLGFLPFSDAQTVYHPVTWIKDGVLTDLSYNRDYAVQLMLQDTGLPNSRVFRMDGGNTPVTQMIENTVRGVLVTRLSRVQLVDLYSLQVTGYTCDGLWLIEKGKISKPVKNFRFSDSILRALNSVLEIGPSQRVFRPQLPAVVPALKIQDFNFTSMSDAI